MCVHGRENNTTLCLKKRNTFVDHNLLNHKVHHLTLQIVVVATYKKTLIKIAIGQLFTEICQRGIMKILSSAPQSKNAVSAL